MALFLALVALIATSSLTQFAFAADTAPAPAPATKSDGPPARTGFQAAFRTGFSFPMGDATGVPADTLGRRYAWQVPIAIDLGAKVTPSIFIGSYLHLGFGAEGSDTEVVRYCDDNDSNLENDVSCSVVTVRLGLEGNYQFQPDQRINPWVGYGIGFESAIQSLTDRQRGYSETNTSSGVTYAQLAGGFDFRALLGFGPYAELALGRFNKVSVEQNGRKTFSGDIEDRAWHAWLTLGVRMVVRP
jgi:hypothetical protein